ncbi:hypothetical protein JCM21714_1426 [Gracilibacillus boraciitolerans JCM 21714]|uniref:Yip1 domain-containing protein n=1 Tax=Gracilibacillus boraciitolerans JCM 21714 TaxID=1298598 RepID=W4VGW0_9BACI|nr:hypothetical protein [Gracilibacillus boraciitolerans]GAE92427.1 hypothetical protein JCM21714_1426 [Gracilibacillus boraciitolerans JCM 21714]
MHYSYLLGLIKAPNDQLYRIERKDVIERQWKIQLLLVIMTVLIYVLMSVLGMGSHFHSHHITDLSMSQYTIEQLWFINGRMVYALIIALGILFIITYYFHLLTEIPYRKLMVMQQVVLVAMLCERLLWIPAFVFLGLDWNVSPLSFGIIASYFTDRPWIINFFGSITIFQLWIIFFQVKYMKKLSILKTYKIWLIVLNLYIFLDVMAAFITYLGSILQQGWM